MPTSAETTVHARPATRQATPAPPATVSRRRVLTRVGSVTAEGAPPVTHQCIEAENLEALNLLVATHSNSVDTIYIDPPYNTGDDTFGYNDHRSAADWVGFMRRRLKVARELLVESGVIFVAVNDREHHRMRTLLDEVFGQANFISNLVWIGQGSHLSRFDTGGVDYMLVYAYDITQARPWREDKDGAEEMIRIGLTARQVGAEQAGKHLREWLRWNRPGAGLSHYNQVDTDGRVFTAVDLTNSAHRPNLRFTITGPDGTVYQPPKNGWACSPERFSQWLDEGRILFTGSRPRKKQWLDEHCQVRPEPFFHVPRQRATRHLAKLMGGPCGFKHSKDHEVLARWIGLVTPPDGVVLDFFGGSGSTLEAVIRLNMADDGARQCILVTNNEVSAQSRKVLEAAGVEEGSDAWEQAGVFRSVTMPRIRSVVTGVTPDGDAHGIPAAPARVEFLALVPKPA